MYVLICFQNIKSGFQALKKRIAYQTADAFVMVIMSHGDSQSNLQSSDEQIMNINDEIVAEFDGDNWPCMQGKPKVFLIQACRGREFQFHLNLYECFELE